MALLLRTIIVLFLFVLSNGTALAQTATSTPHSSGPTATPIPCAPPPSGVVIRLENPSPGDTLLTGNEVVINGVAYDTRSTTGPGISSVTVYLGSRDAGGTALGTAILGQPNPGAAAGSPLANAGFTLRTPAMPSGSGSRSIFVYAKSAIDSSEGVLEVPVYLNSAPTPVRGQVPTAVLPTPAPCTPTPVPTATSAPTNTPAPAPAIATNTPAALATPTPLAVTGPSAPTPISVAPPPVAPAPPAAAAPPTVAPVAAVAPTTAQTTAPRGGGIPSEVGLVIVGLGAVIVAGGLGLGRRRRR